MVVWFGVPVVLSLQNSMPPATCAPSQAVGAVPKFWPVMVTGAPLVVIDDGLSVVTCGGGLATTVNAPAMRPEPFSGWITVTSYGPPGAMPPMHGEALLCGSAAVPLQVGTSAVTVLSSTTAMWRSGTCCGAVWPLAVSSGAVTNAFGAPWLNGCVAGCENWFVIVTDVFCCCQPNFGEIESVPSDLQLGNAVTCEEAGELPKGALQPSGF